MARIQQVVLVNQALCITPLLRMILIIRLTLWVGSINAKPPRRLKPEDICHIP